MAGTGREARVVEVLVGLADSLRAGYEVIDTMDLLVHGSTELTAAVAAGVLLDDGDGGLHIVASTSERASDVEEAQLGLDEGPCVECFRTGEVVEVRDLDAVRGRWPGFVGSALDRGFRSARAVPVRLRGRTLGAMNLFFADADPVSARDAALVDAMTRMCAISIVQQQTLESHVSVQRELHRALEVRVVIEQAKGVVAQQRGLPVDAAFAVIRGHARGTGTRLREVAEAIVARRLEI
jgi:hypothetical protein